MKRIKSLLFVVAGLLVSFAVQARTLEEIKNIRSIPYPVIDNKPDSSRVKQRPPIQKLYRK